MAVIAESGFAPLVIPGLAAAAKSVLDAILWVSIGEEAAKGLVGEEITDALTAGGLTPIFDALEDRGASSAAAATEPLTPPARRYYLAELDHWKTRARKLFSGTGTRHQSALTAALLAVQHAQRLVGDPGSSLLTLEAALRGLDLAFSELQRRPVAGSSGVAAVGAPFSRPQPQAALATSSSSSTFKVVVAAAAAAALGLWLFSKAG